jgi:hypothetical protein
MAVVDPEKLLEPADFLGNVFRLQHHERIVGCTGFPTDSHDTIWMEVNEKKGCHCCVACGHGTFAFSIPRTLADKIFKRSDQTAISWGAEEYGDGHH